MRILPSLLLAAGAAMAAEHAGAPVAAPASASAAVHAVSPAVAPVDALIRLAAGNARFAFGHRSRSASPAGDPARRVEILPAQHPFAAVVACADSRVAPELIFDQGLGDLFVVRNAGNVAEPVGIGSLEYAIEHLGVSVVVVLGHSRCGAVTAVGRADGPLPGNLAAVQSHMPGLRDAVEEHRRAGADPDRAIAAVVVRNAEDQARSLLAGSTVLRARAAHGHLVVVPAVYDLENGLVSFQPVLGGAVAAEHAPAAPGAGHH